MDITTKSGVILTAETLDKLAEEWENDTWEGSLGKVVMGRPRISDEELVNVTFRVPKSWVETVENRAKQQGETKSQFLRNALRLALLAP